MSFAETAALAVRISLDDRLSSGINRTMGSINKLNSGLGRTGRGVGQLAGGIAKTGAVLATVAAGGFIAAAKAAGDFGEQMNVINTIAQLDSSALGKVGDGIRGLARDTGASLTDLTAGYYDLLSAGIKVTDAQNALNLSYKLSRGSLSTTTEAVDFLTTAINAYRLNQAQTNVVADQFAKAVEIGKVKLDQISATFANVASVAHQAGIGIDEIATAYGFLTAQGVPAAEVTTEMNRAIIELLKPNKDLKDLMGKTHINFAKMAADKGLVQALEAMRIAAAKAGIPFQNLFGRLEGYKFALQTTGPAFKKYLAAQKEIQNSNGALEKQYAERQQGLNYQLGVLKQNLIDVAITVGSGFTPALERASKKLVAFLSLPENQTALQNLGKDIGTFIDSIDWDKMLRAAQGATKVLRPMVDALLLIAKTLDALPPEIKGAGAAFLIANKVSGGAIGGGIGNIVGGLGETLAKSLASQIPLFGKAFVQPVFVTNQGFGAGGIGGGGGGAGGIGPGTAFGIAGATVAGVAADTAFHDLGQQISATLANGNKSAADALGKQFDLALGIAFGPFDQIRRLPETIQNLANAITGNKPVGPVGAASNQRPVGEHSASPVNIAYIEPKTVQRLIAAEKTTIGNLQVRLARAIHNGNKLGADRIRAKIEQERQKLIALEARQKAAKGALDRANQLSGTANAKLQRIIAKKTTFRSQTTVNVSTSVSTSTIQKKTKTSNHYGVHSMLQAM